MERKAMARPEPIIKLNPQSIELSIFPKAGIYVSKKSVIPFVNKNVAPYTTSTMLPALKICPKTLQWEFHFHPGMYLW